MFVAEVAGEFILGLDVLRAYDASEDLGRHFLRLGREVSVESRSTTMIIADYFG